MDQGYRLRMKTSVLVEQLGLVNIGRIVLPKPVPVSLDANCKSPCIVGPTSFEY